ncbi:MAG TPA: carbohydrate ABC transporter permease, partial [Atribacteraceae bacterium]|nr:carbohydrate ABC transporter permease [Atribacteraceae bacterium]
MKKKKPIKIVDVFIWLVIGITVLWVITPFYWALITSFKRPIDVFSLSAIPWVQFQPTISNWLMEFTYRGPEISRGLTNSLVISLGASVIAMVMGSLAGYGLSRFQYRRWKNENMALWFLSQRFLPPAATVIPFFLILRGLNMLDTRTGLILINATFAMPFAVLIMRDMFKELPVELEEAALVDGCSRWSTFLRIALPLAAPALVATGIICFAFAWNEFLFALILTFRDAIPMPIIIAGAQHTHGVQFWYVSTRLLLAILPPTILALMIQKYIVRGLT